MLRLLRTLSWRHVQRHRLRTLLTFLGITLGVGVIVAIAVVNRLIRDFPDLELKLVIDDNAHMRRILRTLLHSFGTREVYEAEDGASGLEAFMHFIPDIVICRPVTGMPGRSCLWVPRPDQRRATRSPSQTISSELISRSGNAARIL